MSVTILKDTNEIVEGETQAVNVTVDIFVNAKTQYDAGIALLDPLKKQVEGSKKVLIKHANDHFAPTQELLMDGNEHQVTISPRYKEAELSPNAAILEQIGLDNFLAVAKVSVTELKKYCTPAELESILHYDNTGARRIKVTS